VPILTRSPQSEAANDVLALAQRLVKDKEAQRGKE